MSPKDLKLADNLTMPVDAVTRTFGVVGQRGTGKSTSVAVLVEELAKVGARSVVVDPTGVWWGLAHPGTGPGLPAIILGGEHGDVPLEEAGGHLVAELVVKADYTVVVLDLKLLRKAAQVRFLADFCESLYHSNREALHVVIDEAGRFAPQQLREAGRAPALLGAIEDIVKLGRSRGLGCTLIEQRPAHIAKSVFEQIETLIAFRLIGPRDRKAIHEWVDAQGDPQQEKEFTASIAKLKTGYAWVYSPAFIEFLGQVHFRPAETFDSRRTPKVGERQKEPQKRVPVDLAKLREQMAATIEKAKENDPAELKKRIAEQASRIRQLESAKPAVDPQAIERAVEIAVSKEREAITGKLLLAHANLAKFHMPLLNLAESIGGVARLAAELEHSPPPAAPSIRMQAVPVKRWPKVDPPQRSVSNGMIQSELSSGKQKILNAIAELNVLNVEQPTNIQIAVWVGLSHTTGTFKQNVRELAQDQLIERAGGGHWLTPSGSRAAAAADVPQTPAELIDRWVDKLTNSQGMLLQFTVNHYPQSIEREELARKRGVSPTTGTFKQDLRVLRDYRLIDFLNGAVRATSMVAG